MCESAIQLTTSRTLLCCFRRSRCRVRLTMSNPDTDTLALAPELSVSQWFNTDRDLTLADLRGEVVVIEAFQMLCPGCVSHGIPQAQRVQEVFGQDITVLGLHTVFEHHEAMTPTSLEAFLHEYRVSFPVGVDAYEGGFETPVTMRRYQLRGTPSLLVINRAGQLRANAFGQIEDLSLGALIGNLISEPRPGSTS